MLEYAVLELVHRLFERNLLVAQIDDDHGEAHTLVGLILADLTDSIVKAGHAHEAIDQVQVLESNLHGEFVQQIGCYEENFILLLLARQGV